ncbi:hypothetical protein AAC387_Pa06g0007 [Persea americana]
MVGKLAFSGFPPLWDDEKRQLLLYRRSHRRYNCVFHFSTALRGGKLAVAALPPLSSVVSTVISSFPPLWEEANWQLQLYRLSYRRLSRFSSFPPLTEEENWQLQLYRLSHRRQSHFPVFLPCERRKTGNCIFTAAPIGGKVDFPVFLLCDRRKTGNCSFTAALIGGKVYFPVFLRSEGRKTGNWRYAAGTYGGSVSIRFLIIFSLLLPVGGSWVGACSAK